jgi:hypothetical protein
MKTKSMALFALAAFGALNGIQSAFALPLLAENAAQNVGGLLTVYPDHENPNLFYFAPNSSGVAKSEESGLPRFSLINIVRDQKPEESALGGYMTFTLKLKSNAEQADALKKFIDAGHKVAVLPVMSSTINVKKNDSGAVPLAELFRQLNYSKTGGLMESEIGVNSTLTYVGSKVLTATIDTGSIFNMDYCYMIQGLGPNFDATIYVNMSRVYNHFKAEFRSGSFFHRAQITAEVEKLIKDKKVDVIINGGETKDRDYVYALTERIVARVFVPELKMVPTNSGDGGSGWNFSRYSFSTTHKHEDDTERWTFKGRENQRATFCTNIGLEDVRTHKNALVKDVQI